MKKIILLLVGAMFTLALFATPKIIHVTPTGSTDPLVDGLSWENAVSLERGKALSNANFSQSIDNQVWVKGGTYNLTDAFSLNANMALYGGFAGTETELSQRNWMTNQTIFNQTAAKMVIWGSGQISTGVFTDYDVLLDGFIFQGGRVVGAGGCGQLAQGTTLRNCISRNNSATTNSGAFVFKTVTVSSTVLASTKKVVLDNCLIVNNQSGVSPSVLVATTVPSEIINCTIANNYNANTDITGALTGSAVKMYNSILYNNYNGTNLAKAFGNGTANEFTNNAWDLAASEGTRTLNTLLTASPFVSATSYLGAANGSDKLASAIESADFKLAVGSSCINAGSNSFATATTDLGGATRIQSSIVDMGCYESSPPNVDAALLSRANARLANYQVLKQKILNGDSIVVVYLGGSITEGAMTLPVKGTNMYNEAYDLTGNTDPNLYSWRALTFKNLQTLFPTGKFKMIHAAVGSTHSELATYRLDDNVLSKNTPDLVFIEFAVNDANKGGLLPEADLSIYRTMSFLVKRIEAKNPKVALFIPVSTNRSIRLTLVPVPSMKCHLQFANEMRIPFQDLTKSFYVDPLPSGITTTNVFEGPEDLGNNLHPSPKGHSAYAAAVNTTLSKLFNGESFTFTGDIKPFYTDYPTNAQYLIPSNLPTQSGWEIQKSTEFPLIHVLSKKDVLTAVTPGVPYEYKFKGKSVFLFSRGNFSTGNWRGELEVYVDGILKKTFSDATMISDGKLTFSRCMPIVYDLDPSVEHTLKLLPKANSTGAMNIAFYGFCFDTKVEFLTKQIENSIENKCAIKLFPNPTTDRLKIESANFDGKTEICINNSEGKVVMVRNYSGQLIEIDTQQLSKGLYFCKATCGGKTSVATFVKK